MNNKTSASLGLANMWVAFIFFAVAAVLGPVSD